MKHYLMGYKCLLYLDSKYLVYRELQASEYSFISYVLSKVDVFFCYSVYMCSNKILWNEKINFRKQTQNYITKVRLRKLEMHYFRINRNFVDKIKGCKMPADVQLIKTVG